MDVMVDIVPILFVIPLLLAVWGVVAAFLTVIYVAVRESILDKDD